MGVMTNFSYSCRKGN